MATTTTPPLALLVFPGLDELSEEQVRGTACVWSGTTITTATAVDLGERRVRMLDGAISMFPRACRPCVAEQALAALHEHAPGCEQCVDEAGVCETGRVLTRLIREYRR